MIVFIFGIFSIVQAQLNITSPIKVAKQFQKGIEYSLGNYGFVPYGQTLKGILDLGVPEDYCQVLSRNITSNYSLPQITKILVVRRGNCTFAQKSVNAQSEGYAMVVMVDNTKESVNTIQMINKNESVEVDIPAILISKEQGEQLIEILKLEKEVYVKIKFDEPKHQKVVEYQYWMSSMESDSYKFLEQFRPFQNEMQNYLNFTPHYALWYCEWCKKQNWTVKTELCLSGGRYCAPDPDNNGSLIGQDAVWQALKQICIFKNYQNEWWDYIYHFDKLCLYQNLNNLQECSDRIMTQLKIDIDSVQKCMKGSFNGTDYELDDSSLLREEHQLFLMQGIQTWPLLVVNGQQYRGALSVPFVRRDNREVFDTSHYGPLQLICSGFVNETMPNICKERMLVYIDGGKIKKHSGSSQVWIWVISIISLMLIMGLTVFFYKRQMRKAAQENMNVLVNMAISQYFSLNDKEKSFTQK